MNKIVRWLQDETGLELSEYALATALITLPVVLAFVDLSTLVENVVTNLKNTIAAS